MNPERRQALIGHTLVAIGLGWMITDRLLARALPLTWGGPNIGGGLVLLLAYVAVVAGLLRWCLPAWRRARATKQPLGTSPRVMSAVNVLLAVAYVITLLAPNTSGSGINGAVGVTVDAEGGPVLVLHVCRGSIDEVTIVGPNRGDQRNEQFVELTSTEPITAPTTVPLGDPPAAWGRAPMTLPDDQDLLIASAAGDQSMLRQAVFTTDELAGLTPDVVQYGDDSARVGTAEFETVACSRLD